MFARSMGNGGVNASDVWAAKGLVKSMHVLETYVRRRAVSETEL